MRTCANPDCNRQFQPKSHNQKYHDSDCCRVVTNKRIMDKYYEEKEIRKGKTRVCDNNGCETVLSRYNLASICMPCDTKSDYYGSDLVELLVR